MSATWLWPVWQAIVLAMAWGFTRRGQQRFVRWVTGLALNVEEHTVTQSLVALGRASDWKALESFAEYGSWNLSSLRWAVARRLDRQGGRWRGAWQTGAALLSGRARRACYKEALCLWRVLGHDVAVKAVVAEVEGYRQRFTLVSSATDLGGLQMLGLFCARSRQEGAFRDLKQRLGREECRAWARDPIERTTAAVLVAPTALRLLLFESQAERGDDWWLHPPWNPHKSRPSILDVERLLRQHQEELRRGLAEWLDDGANTGS